MASIIIALRQTAVEPSLEQAAFDRLPVAALAMNAAD